VELIESDIASLSSKLVPDSIDAIITDPPYPEEFLPVYDDLGKLATDVLKAWRITVDDGGHFHLPAVIASLSRT